MFINLSGYSPTDTSFPLVRVDEQFFTDVCVSSEGEKRADKLWVSSQNFYENHTNVIVYSI